MDLKNSVKVLKIEKMITTISQYIDEIEKFAKEINSDKSCEYVLYYRGESKDREENALCPKIYRNKLNEEHSIYREMRRFNDIAFSDDLTTFDRLSRMQHYGAPTRLIDMTEEPLAALWFAIEKGKKDDACVYVMAFEKSAITYYDSDSVAVISNLAKLPLHEQNYKSKELIARITKEAIDKMESLSILGNKRTDEFIGKIRKLFNNNYDCISYLYHEIRNDIRHFERVIHPKHIASVLCVKPKLSNNRIYNQKGAFLLFGLNLENVETSIKIIAKEKDDLYIANTKYFKNPVSKILKLHISNDLKCRDLEMLGIRKPYIYPEIDKVAEYFS